MTDEDDEITRPQCVWCGADATTCRHAKKDPEPETKTERKESE